MSEHNITVEGGSSVRLPTAGKYCDRDIVITVTGAGEDIEAELAEQENKVAELISVLEGKAAGNGGDGDETVTVINNTLEAIQRVSYTDADGNCVVEAIISSGDSFVVKKNSIVFILGWRSSYTSNLFIDGGIKLNRELDDTTAVAFFVPENTSIDAGGVDIG